MTLPNITAAPNEEPAAFAVASDINIPIRRSAIDVLPAIVMFFVTLLSTAYSMTLGPLFVQDITVFNIDLQVPVFGLVPVLIGIFIIRGLHNWAYALCPDYVIEIRGRLSLQQRSIRIHYQHIHILEIVQSIYQRIVGVGDILIETAAGEGADGEIILRGIRDPGRVKDEIDRRIMLSKGSPSF